MNYWDERLKYRIKLVSIFLLTIFFFMFIFSHELNPETEIEKIFFEKIESRKKYIQSDAYSNLKNNIGLENTSYIIEDELTGDLISENYAQQTIYPASLSKVFVIDYAKEYVELEDILKVEAEMIKMQKEHSSTARLVPGEYFAKDIIAAMMIPSGNDASYVLAINTNMKKYGEEVKDLNNKEHLEMFIRDLNIYLKEKGYTNTKITDPSGYTYEDYTSPEDVINISKSMMRYSWFRAMVKTTRYKAQNSENKILTWKNSSELMKKDGKYYYPGVEGIKTGTLKNCYNISIYAKIKENSYYITILGEFEKDDLYSKAKLILDELNN